MLLPASTVFGMVYPLLFRLPLFPVSERGTWAGRIGAANAVGCVLGALATAFAAIPSLGSERTLLALVTIAAGSGALLTVAYGRSRRRWLAVVAASVLVRSCRSPAALEPRRPDVGGSRLLPARARPPLQPPPLLRRGRLRRHHDRRRESESFGAAGAGPPDEREIPGKRRRRDGRAERLRAGSVPLHAGARAGPRHRARDGADGPCPFGARLRAASRSPRSRRRSSRPLGDSSATSTGRCSRAR